MEEILGVKKFTRTIRNSWQVIFDFMVQAMTKGMDAAK
jgi:hypothetical protein